jgi:hypothetical protein
MTQRFTSKMDLCLIKGWHGRGGVNFGQDIVDTCIKSIPINLVPGRSSR